jgi:hypothetical protein
VTSSAILATLPFRFDMGIEMVCFKKHQGTQV